MISTRKFKKIYIEISNICNLQCDFCPEVVRDKKIMGEDLFEKIIAEMGPLTDEVCFHLMGEPLAHPQFSRFVEICAQYKVPVNITTNGTLLNDSRSISLLHPIVRQVNFSLQSFESNFQGQSDEAYLNKIFNFTKQALRERPDLYINYRFWNLAEATIDPNQKSIDKIEAYFNVTVNRSIDVTLRKSRKLLGRLYLHFDTRFEWPSLNAPLRANHGFCYGLSSHMAIHADGTVVPCCLDKEAGVDLGNCKNQSVQSVLDGPRAIRVADGFKRYTLVESLCQRCTFIERFDKKVPQKLQEQEKTE